MSPETKLHAWKTYALALERYHTITIDVADAYEKAHDDSHAWPTTEQLVERDRAEEAMEEAKKVLRGAGEL